MAYELDEAEDVCFGLLCVESILRGVSDVTPLIVHHRNIELPRYVES